MVLAWCGAYSQVGNFKELRLVHKNDSVGISGIGMLRWDNATGKFRFWNGTSWFSYPTFSVVPDGDKGDITVSGTGTAWTINPASVSFAKFQNSAAAGMSVIGRSANSAGVFAEIVAGTDGHVLRRSGTTLGFGTLANTSLANSSISFATGTTGTDVTWSSSPISLGGTATLNIPNASATARGLVTTGTQTIAGAKAFTSNILINNTTPRITFEDSDEDLNLKRWEFGGSFISAQNVHLRFLNDDGSLKMTGMVWTPAGNVGIGTVNPTALLHVSQSALTSAWIPALRVDPGAHTAMTLSTEFPNTIVDIVTQQWATGALTTQRFNWWKAPTIAFVGASTASDVYNGYFSTPVAGTNATITRNWSLGTEGNLYVGGSTLRLGASSTAGYVLKTDASGNGTWQASGGITNTAAANEVTKSNGTNIVGTGLFTSGAGVYSTTGNFSLTTTGDATINTVNGVGFSMDANGTNNVPKGLLVARTTPDSPAVGIGTSIATQVETSSGNGEIGSYLETVTTDVTALSEDFDFVVKLMQNGTAPTEKIRVTSTGNLGIGLVTPNAPLQFANTVVNRKIVLYEAANNDNEFTGFGTNSGVFRYQVSTPSVSHVWYAGTSATTSNELMRLTGEGRLGIGTSPAYALDILAADPIMRLITTAGEPKIILNRQTGTASFWQIQALIGSTDLTFGTASATPFSFSAAGTGTATDWVATSDIRLKENIVKVGSQLSKISSISNLVSNYDRKDTKKNETGFIAQELLKITPEYVGVPADTAQMMSVNYAKMVVPLYKGVAELSSEIEQLKKEIAEIKKLLK